jgi:hypothetical protein
VRQPGRSLRPASDPNVECAVSLDVHASEGLKVADYRDTDLEPYAQPAHTVDRSTASLRASRRGNHMSYAQHHAGAA